MDQTETLSKEEVRKEQNRMVEHVVTNYEKIESVEFKNFVEDEKTGYYTSLAIINNEYEVQFNEPSLEGTISMDYSSDFLTNHPKTENRGNIREEVQIIYSRGE